MSNGQAARWRGDGLPRANDRRLTFGDLAESVSVTHSLSKPQLVFLNTSDIERGRVLHRNYTAVATWPGQAKKSIRKGDILFSEIRPANGRYAFVDFDADDYVVSTAPRRLVWIATFTITCGSRGRWACGQGAKRLVHMSTGRS